MNLLISCKEANTAALAISSYSLLSTKPIDGLMKNIMTEKVDQHFQDWLFAEEGLTLELPPNSDNIVISNFDA